MYKLILTYCALTVCALVPEQIPSADVQEIEAISRPSKDVTMAFVRPGKVAEVLVVDGQEVKAGQGLIQLDDKAERIQLEQLRAQYEININVEAAEAQRDMKKVELEKVRKAAMEGATTDLELQSAEVAYKIEGLRVEKAHFDKAQARREYDANEALVQRMRLVSPIDGRVEGIAVEGGESAEAYEKVIRVVNIDRLWIDVPVPLARARESLAVNSPAWVLFRNADGKVDRSEGKIIKLGAVADASSGTLSVRVEVANPTGRQAGEHVRVTFPPAAAVNAGGDSASVRKHQESKE